MTAHPAWAAHATQSSIWRGSYPLPLNISAQPMPILHHYIARQQPQQLNIFKKDFSTTTVGPPTATAYSIGSGLTYEYIHQIFRLRPISGRSYEGARTIVHPKRHTHNPPSPPVAALVIYLPCKIQWPGCLKEKTYENQRRNFPMCKGDGILIR